MRQPYRVIVVDDSPEDTFFARRAVSEVDGDIDVVVMDRAPQVRRHLDGILEGGRVPDLILLDLKMPALDGHEVLEAIRERCDPGQLPVVVFSSSVEPSDLIRAYRVGANSYVRKPVVFEEFQEVVRDVVRYWTQINRRAPEDVA